MALSRFGEADVYVFEAYLGEFDQPSQLTCCGCSLEEKGSFWADTTDKMYDHLLAHKAAGDKIPDWLLAEVTHYTLGEE